MYFTPLRLPRETEPPEEVVRNAKLRLPLPLEISDAQINPSLLPCPLEPYIAWS